MHSSAPEAPSKAVILTALKSAARKVGSGRVRLGRDEMFVVTRRVWFAVVPCYPESQVRWRWWGARGGLA
jgi:hypothetical protein